MVDNSLDAVFSLNEFAEINQTISQIYDRTAKNPTQSLSDFSANFLKDLNKHVDFDKGNILFYNYNSKVNTYEVSYFYHIGWNKNDIDNYINHYCHIDDVLPILSGDREIAFRNGNIFSFWEQTKYYREFVKPAQIVNSIDANILLPQNIEINAIIGLFRNTNKTGFSQKDFETVKTCQPHLSNALSQYLISKQKPANDLLDIFCYYRLLLSRIRRGLLSIVCRNQCRLRV